MAPDPLEVVLSAGQKAKEEPRKQGEDDAHRRNNLTRDMSDIMGEDNIESMLSVEMGLRELSSLKIINHLVNLNTWRHLVDISTMLEKVVHYVKFMHLQIKLLSFDELWMYAPLAYDGVNVRLPHLDFLVQE